MPQVPRTPESPPPQDPGRSTPGAEGRSPGWRRAASLTELRSRGRIRVEVEGQDILLVRDGPGVLACGNVCAHQHFAMLHAGAIHGRQVTCPMHGWTYDLATGRSVSGEGRIPVYAVKVQGDDVFVAAGE